MPCRSKICCSFSMLKRTRDDTAMVMAFSGFGWEKEIKHVWFASSLGSLFTNTAALFECEELMLLLSNQIQSCNFSACRDKFDFSYSES